MASTNESLLPPARPDQKYVTVSPIPGGFITLADNFFVHPADPGAKRTVPSLTFLITHPGPATAAFQSNDKKPFRLMFDLGLRKSQQRYPEHLQTHIDGRAPFQLEPGVAAQLREGGLPPDEIDVVILSHVHYDHHGDPEVRDSKLPILARFLPKSGALTPTSAGHSL
jgi:glyoxylase-like metal-dependent hydrolase (beta-lactamase superfamily II)